MTDCYHILGVPASASAAEIRSAYLAKMKALHPDLRPAAQYPSVNASDVTFAYWQLRDATRRAQHDAGILSRPEQPRSRPAKVRRAFPAGKARLSLRARRRRGARLQPVRTAAGALAFAVAALGFVLAFTYLQPQGAGRAQAASLATGEQPARAGRERVRRTLDPVLAESAADEFRMIVRSAGLDGAHVYGRQCHAELAAQPSLSMLDYCIAFDDAAADWERTVAGAAANRRYFDDDQRIARYRSLAQSVRESSVRAALLNEVGYWADRGS